MRARVAVARDSIWMTVAFIRQRFACSLGASGLELLAAGPNLRPPLSSPQTKYGASGFVAPAPLASVSVTDGGSLVRGKFDTGLRDGGHGTSRLPGNMMARSSSSARSTW